MSDSDLCLERSTKVADLGTCTSVRPCRSRGVEGDSVMEPIPCLDCLEHSMRPFPELRATELLLRNISEVEARVASKAVQTMLPRSHQPTCIAETDFPRLSDSRGDSEHIDARHREAGSEKHPTLLLSHLMSKSSADAGCISKAMYTSHQLLPLKKVEACGFGLSSIPVSTLFGMEADRLVILE